jgi:hypothetical protein
MHAELRRETETRARKIERKPQECARSQDAESGSQKQSHANHLSPEANPVLFCFPQNSETPPPGCTDLWNCCSSCTHLSWNALPLAWSPAAVQFCDLACRGSKNDDDAPRPPHPAAKNCQAAPKQKHPATAARASTAAAARRGENVVTRRSSTHSASSPGPTRSGSTMTTTPSCSSDAAISL